MFWPVAFACAGLALVWRQADERPAGAGGPRPLRPDPRHACSASGGWPALVRVIVGLGLVGAAFGIVIAQQGQNEKLPRCWR